MDKLRQTTVPMASYSYKIIKKQYIDRFCTYVDSIVDKEINRPTPPVTYYTQHGRHTYHIIFLFVLIYLPLKNRVVPE